MAVLTWSFNSGYNGWTFEDRSLEFSPACGVCSSSRSHVSGAIRVNGVIAGAGAGLFTWGTNTSPDGLNVSIQNGDTIDVDYGATSDAIIATTQIDAYYTDETTEQALVIDAIASTLTLTLTQNKTLDYIDVSIARSTGPGGGPYDFTRDMLEVTLTTAGAISATAGKLRTPQAVIEDLGAGAAGGAGGGSGGNLAAISADGLNIYIASFNNLGFPTLVKIQAALTADGSIVFDPGDGARIGVQTAAFNADHLWVAGLFDGTNTVEKSEDAGTSFDVKDDGTFGAIRTFEVGPDSDNRIMLFDGDNGDIIQSIDGGTTWTAINSGITPLVNSIARFGQNPEECVFANAGAANNSIDYSPNEGANLEDYQTGVYPATDATKVIAN